jgi:aerobic-type carbon monoxide dehydrogenase small subunit (CoxS/CutS family)
VQCLWAAGSADRIAVVVHRAAAPIATADLPAVAVAPVAPVAALRVGKSKFSSHYLAFGEAPPAEVTARATALPPVVTARSSIRAAVTTYTASGGSAAVGSASANDDDWELLEADAPLGGGDAVSSDSQSPATTTTTTTAAAAAAAASPDSLHAVVAARASLALADAAAPPPSQHATSRFVCSFYLNGALQTPDLDALPLDMSLVAYIREVAKLTGTKIACNEGGCGACSTCYSFVQLLSARILKHSRTLILCLLPLVPFPHPHRAAVLLSYKSAADGSVVSVPVNACLRPLLSCDGMSVTTVEGVGSLRAGYHPVQTRLAQNAGSQCGFCSPGFAVTAFALLIATPAGQKPTAQQVEDQFQGNLCRCTGYRPILEAFRSFCGGGANGEPAAGAWLMASPNEVAH